MTTRTDSGILKGRGSDTGDHRIDRSDNRAGLRYKGTEGSAEIADSKGHGEMREHMDALALKFEHGTQIQRSRRGNETGYRQGQSQASRQAIQQLALDIQHERNGTSLLSDRVAIDVE